MSSALVAATTAAPKDNEVCFSPVDPCDIKLVKFIESAQKSVDVAVYDINLDQVGHALLAKSLKIPVRIVVDTRQSKEKNSIVPMLIKAGANLRFGHQRGIMHNKFIVVDGKRLETGSFNFTNHASESNNENQVYLAAPEIVSRYARRFEEIFSEGKAP
jgi:phosphatidylserine/phosphatidylglycerophosphate/cardiolipin synthase-like enzyme